MRPPERRHRVGFMPHHSSLPKWGWRSLCEEAGLVYLDPRSDPVETLKQLNGVEKIITEAMHGAIVADALRIPWIPLRINQWNYTGKWDDWASTIRLPIHFRVVPELYDPTLNQPRSARINWRMRVLLGRRTPPSSTRVVDFVRHELRRMAEADEGQLSDDGVIRVSVERFLTAADLMRNGVARL